LKAWEKMRLEHYQSTEYKKRTDVFYFLKIIIVRPKVRKIVPTLVEPSRSPVRQVGVVLNLKARTLLLFVSERRLLFRL
jgi:hypothetical protein